MQNIAREHIESQLHTSRIHPSGEPARKFVHLVANGPVMTLEQARSVAREDVENFRPFVRRVTEFTTERKGFGPETAALYLEFPHETRQLLGRGADMMRSNRIPRAVHPEDVTHAPKDFAGKVIVDSNAYRV